MRQVGKPDLHPAPLLDDKADSLAPWLQRDWYHLAARERPVFPVIREPRLRQGLLARQPLGDRRGQQVTQTPAYLSPGRTRRLHVLETDHLAVAPALALVVDLLIRQHTELFVRFGGDRDDG